MTPKDEIREINKKIYALTEGVYPYWIPRVRFIELERQSTPWSKRLQFSFVLDWGNYMKRYKWRL